MSDFELVRADSLPADDSYVVACWKCGEKFDATSAPWCDCRATLRTVKCFRCGSCFCQASFLFKQKFWSNSPKSLRENSLRFGDPTLNAPVPGVAAPASLSALHRPHVLIVDDEEPVRSLAACYVEQIGYRVTTASGPEEALVVADAIAFDAVLTDALMPKMDGRELCRKLKEMHGNQLKVIIMTSLYKSRTFQMEARHVFKVDEYLTKPLRYDDLRDALQRVAPLGRRPADWKEALAG